MVPSLLKFTYIKIVSYFFACVKHKAHIAGYTFIKGIIPIRRFGFEMASPLLYAENVIQ